MDNRKITNFFSAVFLLFYARLALPQYVKFILFPSVALFVTLSFIDFFSLKTWKVLNTKDYKLFTPLFISIFVWLFAFANSTFRSVILLKDTINILVLGIFIFSFLLLDFKYEHLKKSLNQFKAYGVVLSTLFAFAGVLKLFFQLKGQRWGVLEVKGEGYPLGTSLAIDDNFFTLVCVVGISFVSHYLFSVKNRLQSILLQISLWVLLVNIILATSRRGLIIASIYTVIFLLFWFISWFIKSEFLKRFRNNSFIFLFSFLATVFLFGYLLFGVDSFKRNQWLVSSNFNKNETVTFLNSLTMKGKSIFYGGISYSDVQKENWYTNFDSRFPYTGWADGNYKIVTNLPDLNLTNVPSDAQGAMIGNWIVPFKRDNSAYYLTKIFKDKIQTGKRYVASIYCLVTHDCNISRVRLSAWGDIRGLKNWFYDDSKKGTWQKLYVSFIADSGNYTVGLFAELENDSSFKSLKGSIIFAYPEINEVEFSPNEPITWAQKQYELVKNIPDNNKNLPCPIVPIKPDKRFYWYNQSDDVWRYNVNLQTFNRRVNNRIIASLYVYVSPDFDGDEVSLYAGGKIFGHSMQKYDLNRKGTWQKLYLSFTIFEGDAWVDYGFRKKVNSPTDSIKGYVLFAYPEEKILKFDPNNPITWAGSNFKRVFPLTGENVGIVPKQSVGLMVDRGTQARVSKNLAYNVNPIGKVKFKEANERVKTSIYAYVSNDFNGEKVRLGGSSKKLGGNNATYYDLSRKGTWQKLTINNWGETGEVYYSTTYFELPKAKDFKNLKGYVIYAHPEFKVLKHNPKNPETYTASTFLKEYPLKGSNADIVPKGVVGAKYNKTTEGKRSGLNYYSRTLYWGEMAEPGDSVFGSVYCYVSPDFNGNLVRLELTGKITGSSKQNYNLKTKGEWVQLKVSGLVKGKGRVYGSYLFGQKGVTDFSNLKGYVTFAYPQLVVKHNKKTSLLEGNNLQYIASFLSLPKSHSVPDTISDDFKPLMANDRFAGPRVDRWRYAIYLYTKKYSLIQKIFGGGFDYTYRFARKFHPEDPKRDFDYPHNPFLSVLLYSGVLGLLVYIWFFVKSLYLYYIYRKEYWIFGIIYLVTFFYAFFSSNSPFEPAFFGLMGALPYLIHYSKKSNELRDT